LPEFFRFRNLQLCSDGSKDEVIPDSEVSFLGVSFWFTLIPENLQKQLPFEKNYRFTNIPRVKFNQPIHWGSKQGM
jgi:hypothetical protein